MDHFIRKNMSCALTFASAHFFHMTRIILALLILCPLLASAGFTPAENSKLNYRIVGFSAPCKGRCALQIASGRCNNIDSFKNNIIITRMFTDGRVIAEVPGFGADYSWRILEEDNSKTQIHHFSTLPCPNADTSKAQFRIITNTGQCNNYYVFVDVTGTLYDMQGQPVWFLPPHLQKPFVKSGNRDFKATTYSTISFLNEDEATEIDYNGNVRFSVRGTGVISGDTTELLHHEFTRLANGHYMVLGSERVKWSLPYFHPDSVQTHDPSFVQGKDDTTRQKLEFGTIIEYDETGKMVWSWRSSGYFKNSDLFTHFRPNGMFRFVDVHENAFFFDEKKKVVYIGFRDISRIVKIKYPEGTILAGYGAKSDNTDDVLCNDFFCGQHRIAVNNDGDLCVYNNNATANGADPEVVVLRETAGKAGGLEKVWEFDCPVDGMNESEVNADRISKEQTAMLNKVNPGAAKVTRMTSGGNVVPLDGGSYFVSTSRQFARSFIVNKNKEILWSAVPEIRIYSGGPWTAIATYRESIITDKELESLIWNAQ